MVETFAIFFVLVWLIDHFRDVEIQTSDVVLWYSLLLCDVK